MQLQLIERTPVTVYYLEGRMANEVVCNVVNKIVVLQFLLKEKEKHKVMISERGCSVHDGMRFIDLQ